MEKTRLRNLLRQLHEELETADSVGPEARELLANVNDDIEELLERSETAADGEEPTLKNKLDEAVVEFENSHPQLAYTIERIVQSLSNMGI